MTKVANAAALQSDRGKGIERKYTHYTGGQEAILPQGIRGKSYRGGGGGLCGWGFCHLCLHFTSNCFYRICLTLQSFPELWYSNPILWDWEYFTECIT